MPDNSYGFDPSVFDDALEREKINAAAEGMNVPGFPWNHPAVKFAKWYIDKFGHGGPKGSESWINHGADYTAAKDYATAGTDDSAGTDSDADVLAGYANSNTVTNDTVTNDTVTNDTVTNDTVIDEITVVAKPPSGIGQVGELVRWAGIVYIYDALGGWIPSPDPLHNPPMEETTVTGKIPEKADILGGLESLLGMGIGLDALKEMVANMSNSGSGNEDNWFDKLIDLVAAKNAYEEGYKYEVPTGQMASQSEIGKQWGLPSKEDMVMQGMGPNYLQDQQYVLSKGTTMPAATHVSGNPLLKEIEGGKQGGIMGLKSHGDITPAFLEPGEFVFTKKATDNMGAKRLYKLMQQAEQMGMN